MRNYHELQKTRWDNGLFVCVGLDTDPDKVPKHRQSSLVEQTITHFNCDIVDATRDIVCAYKPNTAFYEAYGAPGIRALERTIGYIQDKFPEIPVILDYKRGDIGNTNNGYVKFAFDYCHADAVTLHPYLGREALEPFLARADKGIFILCRTSNPGAGEFQDEKIYRDQSETVSELGDISSLAREQGWNQALEGDFEMSVYEYVALRVSRSWNTNSNCGLVVGATSPSELKYVRKIVGDMPILIPGIGAQGGDLEAVLGVCRDSKGQGMIINLSRSVLYASNGKDFADRARDEVLRMNQSIQQTLGITRGE